ncbi:hypothetical protein QY694_10160, partial [Xanthomonas campestris pv. incanae]|nr:hypothetical protein [Xanthomonas campestris pv. incanae]
LIARKRAPTWPDARMTPYCIEVYGAQAEPTHLGAWSGIPAFPQPSADVGARLRAMRHSRDSFIARKRAPT